MLTRYQSNTAGMVDSDVCIVTIQRTTVKIRDVMATSMTSLVINPGGTNNWFASYLDVNLNSVQNPEKMKPKTITQPGHGYMYRRVQPPLHCHTTVRYGTVRCSKYRIAGIVDTRHS